MLVIAGIRGLLVVASTLSWWRLAAVTVASRAVRLTGLSITLRGGLRPISSYKTTRI